MRPGLLLAAAALLAPPVLAAPPLELEREATRIVAERDALAGQKRALQSEAAALAETLTAAGGIGTTRADPAVSRRLRDFDRVAERLDALDRGITDRGRDLARACARFESAAAEEEKRLEAIARTRGAAAVAEELAALDAARRRVLRLQAAASFRPPLDVTIEPLDGSGELETKLALIEGERTRVTSRLEELRVEESVLGARAEARREWARRLAAARRDAAGSVELLDRGYEDAQGILRDLAQRAQALARERAALEAAQRTLTARRGEAERRLEELRKK